jgi:hypothetical protein
VGSHGGVGFCASGEVRAARLGDGVLSAGREVVGLALVLLLTVVSVCDASRQRAHLAQDGASRRLSKRKLDRGAARRPEEGTVEWTQKVLQWAVRRGAP